MAKRKTGWPFLEGFIIDGTQETHVFTDYRWDDGSVSRRQFVDPDSYDPTLVIVRPVSLKLSDRQHQ
ncbi:MULTISPECIES: hypothetical protein [Roseobacteraceae]|jgi:hypothetical protein|uniref:hypothetical protein n=1 Tax=Roseobacteraceae TaxID=2854170 RepID=UPI0012682D47|nr:MULTISPECIES: hypothetical protein [Roseobacteraceae]MBO9436207.1 hypothetical protein [Ruegeria sp. R13_0]MBO9448576.1 hypothetical protein [Ruegeria sp. R14_0]MBO9467621.1 hypothetical protein [Tropicibacter sp. R15_0]QFT75892.1 hypothetical protein FIU92_22790 [Ruegeria sp. THAF33]CAD0187134.1 hypothetical protein RUESEDTHA_04046 [Ruegeria sp. THAF57]